MVRQLKHRVDEGQEEEYAIASILAVLQQRKDAIDWLEKAYRRRNGAMILMQVDPALDSLRGEPRFHDLLRAMRFES